MQRLLIGLILAVFSCSNFASAEEPNAGDFARGNALYADGKFAEAVNAYEAQAHRGDDSANLFYNLGNAYFRLGERGRAILNYQRALLLEPSHSEATANLAFTRGRSFSPLKGGGVANWFEVDRWTLLATVGGWLAVIGLGVAAFRRPFRWFLVTVGTAGLSVCASTIWAIVQMDGGAKNPARAVVLSDDTKALYSPADNSKAVFTLPAGGEVLVLSEQGAWDYVQLGDGSRGWVSAERVEKVVPPAARG